MKIGLDVWGGYREEKWQVEREKCLFIGVQERIVVID